MNSTSPRLLHDIENQPESLRRVLERQNTEGRAAMDEARRILRSGRRVVISGMGASMFASVPFEYLLTSAGLDAVLIESAELLHYRRQACEGATVVLVSRSGESVEISKLLCALRGATTVIGVTNDPDGELARGADCPVVVGSLADEMVAVQSYTGTVLTLLLLAAAVAGEFGSTRDAAASAIDALPSFIGGSLERIAEWDEFLDARATYHLLGRGFSCGSALEGALLFNETAKAPAMGMPAASFRHGPVELVDSSFRGLVFAPQGRTRALNLALAADLARFGGRVRVIGCPDVDGDGQDWCATPDVPEPIAPLVEVIPVQVAALRLAQLKGLRVGSFRYTPQVARDEASFAPVG